MRSRLDAFQKTVEFALSDSSGLLEKAERNVVNRLYRVQRKAISDKRKKHIKLLIASLRKSKHDLGKFKDVRESLSRLSGEKDWNV